MQQFTLTIPMEWTISNNRDTPRWLRDKVKTGISGLTRDAAAGLIPVGKATVFVGTIKRTRGIYDPQNLGDTFKPMVDTLVNMGILDADDYRHVMGPWCYPAGVDKSLATGVMRARVTLTDYSEIPF